MASVLIVDDAAFMRMMIKEILSRQGLEIAGEAENGQTAVNMFRELRPDLVTMDIMMPEMDGIAALKQIIEQDGMARVVMCSAVGQQQTVIEAIKAGAKDFIVKPFSPERVVEAITKALES